MREERVLSEWEDVFEEWIYANISPFRKFFNDAVAIKEQRNNKLDVKPKIIKLFPMKRVNSFKDSQLKTLLKKIQTNDVNVHKILEERINELRKLSEIGIGELIKCVGGSFYSKRSYSKENPDLHMTWFIQYYVKNYEMIDFDKTRSQVLTVIHGIMKEIPTEKFDLFISMLRGPVEIMWHHFD